MKSTIGVLTVLVFLLPVTTNAETVLRVGQDISVETDQVINGDYYVSVGPFGRTTMSGTVAGDMVVVAGSALVNGSIGGDALLFAGAAQLHASTSDDVRIVAGEAIISEAVNGDVFVMAGTLQVLSSAKIAGNVYFFGGDATIEGTVDGSLYGTAERIRVDGQIGQNIDVRTPAGLTLGDQASVAGSITYASAVPLQRSQGSVVEGDIVEQATKSANAREAARGVLTPLFIILFASLSLFLLFKRGLQALVERIDESMLITSGIGAAAIFGAPIVAMLLLVTVLGLLLGLMVLGGLVILYTVAIALTGVVAGAFLSKYFRSRLEVSLPTIIVGSVVLQGLMFIPVLGFLVVALCFILTLGGLTQSAYQVLHTRAE